MSINPSAGGWLTIWLLNVDGVLVNVLDGYMALCFLPLAMSQIGAGGGVNTRQRPDIIVDK